MRARCRSRLPGARWEEGSTHSLPKPHPPPVRSSCYHRLDVNLKICIQLVVLIRLTAACDGARRRLSRRTPPYEVNMRPLRGRSGRGRGACRRRLQGDESGPYSYQAGRKCYGPCGDARAVGAAPVGAACRETFRLTRNCIKLWHAVGGSSPRWPLVAAAALNQATCRTSVWDSNTADGSTATVPGPGRFQDVWVGLRPTCSLRSHQATGCRLLESINFKVDFEKSAFNF